jgi:hypothetical protein
MRYVLINLNNYKTYQGIVGSTLVVKKSLAPCVKR